MLHSRTQRRSKTANRRAIEDITIGERCRRDLGNIDDLAADIADIGLLHPVVVTPKNELVVGARRLVACKELGWPTIPVTVLDLDDIVRGEYAENAHRKDFLPSEIDAIRRAVEPLEKAAAKERMSEGGRGAKVSRPSRATDRIGAFAGISGRTVEKIAAVMEAAKADPKKFGQLPAKMDRTGRVDAVYRRLRVARQADQIRKSPPPLPGRGPYRVGVADPAWPYEVFGGVLPYPSMSIEEICAMPVAPIFHRDSILWLWTTNAHTRDAFKVLDAWGFEHRTTLTWVKNRIGTGNWLRGQTEQCLMATRGKPVVVLKNQSTVLMAPVRAHSQKPPEFYDLVEELCPAPRYADLFSGHKHNEKWDCHGPSEPNAVVSRAKMRGASSQAAYAPRSSPTP